MPGSILATSADTTATASRASKANRRVTNGVGLATQTSDLKANLSIGNKARVVTRLCEANLRLLKKAGAGAPSATQAISQDISRGRFFAHSN